MTTTTTTMFALLKAQARNLDTQALLLSKASCAALVEGRPVAAQRLAEKAHSLLTWSYELADSAANLNNEQADELVQLDSKAAAELGL